MESKEGADNNNGAKALESTAPAGFHVMCTGQIQSIQYYGVSNLYCRYAMDMGPDWTIAQGVDAGLSQIGYKSPGMNEIVLNFPIDVSFRSTNPFGWPRIVLSVYGVDGLGRDVVRGYGSVHLPTRSGCYERTISLFRPRSSSKLQEWAAMLTGNPPEYFDSKFIAQNEGREVTRVQSTGRVKVKLNIVTHGMVEHGYSQKPEQRIPMESDPAGAFRTLKLS